MEIKITLARLLKMYSLKVCEKTIHPLQTNPKTTQAPISEVYVTIEPRNL